MQLNDVIGVCGRSTFAQQAVRQMTRQGQPYRSSSPLAMLDQRGQESHTSMRASCAAQACLVTLSGDWQISQTAAAVLHGRDLQHCRTKTDCEIRSSDMAQIY